MLLHQADLLTLEESSKEIEKELEDDIGKVRLRCHGHIREGQAAFHIVMHLKY